MVTVYPSTVEREYIVRNGFLHAGMETFNMKRVFLIVLDSVGIGEMPDAADYGDAGSNTIRAVASSPYFSIPPSFSRKIRPDSFLFLRSPLRLY